MLIQGQAPKGCKRGTVIYQIPKPAEYDFLRLCQYEDLPWIQSFGRSQSPSQK